MTGSSQLQQKEKDRFKVLQAMYEAAEEAESGSMPMFTPQTVGPAVGFDANKVGQIFDYLEGEGLVETMAFGHTVAITHRGRMEVEAYIRNPERGTEHFSFGPLTQNFYAAVGAVQTGANNKAEVTQNLGVGVQEVLALIGQLRAEIPHLPPEVQAEVEAELVDLEEEAAKPVEKPNRFRKLTASMTSLATLATGAATFTQKLHEISTQLGLQWPTS